MPKKNNLKVLFVASECNPIAKVGGLADVIGSLPKALDELGIDVRLALPKYGVIDNKKYPSKLVASGINVLGEKINIYQTFLPESKIIVYLLENEKFFSENHIYFERTAFVGSFREIERFLFFSESVLKIFDAISWFPDVLHCHDWHTSFVPVFAKIKKQNIKTLLTIHNLANQGRWNKKEILNFLRIKGNELESFKAGEKDDLNIFEQGILNADILNTVSKNYREEILTAEFGEKVENSLKKRKKDLHGILNGLDVEKFNPKTDPDLKINYSPDNLERRLENKTDLQKILGFETNKKIPILGLINRLADQKGIDLVIEIIPELVKMRVQLVILGVGAIEYEKKLRELCQKYPKNVSSQIKFDAALAQKIYGGIDIFLMPSRFEPCGLGQMIAMRYGAIPVVRKTGGLADTVKNNKTGFLFEKYESSELLKTVKLALNVYKNKKAWAKIVKMAMSQDFSWQKSSKEYLKLYKKLAI
ncbi:MAG: glycogen/starch synthase [Candidatus Pacebacteria bacterium]|nr:glycogen/starch synthase [Candidatus Paceibacterota bacterium]